MNSGIYKITCVANGRIYIGQSINILYRWKLHRNTLKKGNHGNPILQACYNKYGLDSLEFSIIELMDKDETRMDETEKCSILEARNNFGPLVMNFGDDVHNPMRGRRHTEEAKMKIRNFHLGKKRAPFTAQHRAKMSEVRKGVKQSKEHAKKAADARRGLVRSEEAKIKTANTHRGMKRSNKARANMAKSGETRERMRLAAFARWAREKSANVIEWYNY